MSEPGQQEPEQKDALAAERNTWGPGDFVITSPEDAAADESGSTFEDFAT